MTRKSVEHWKEAVWSVEWKQSGVLQGKSVEYWKERPWSTARNESWVQKGKGLKEKSMKYWRGEGLRTDRNECLQLRVLEERMEGVLCVLKGTSSYRK
jgi:hypothetical protein